jgi:hypothetical protein
MDEPHKTARTRFDESTAHFRKAHREGIAGLDRRDLDAVDAAIATNSGCANSIRSDGRSRAGPG